jgi:hypothetical protein
MRVIVLGAGASKVYTSSKSGCRMPMARDFFKTYQSLPIAADPRVLVGKILQFGKDYLNLNYEEMFEANLDIEELHSRIEEELLGLRSRATQPGFGIEEVDLLFVSGAYDQLVFLFASVLNEVQNGPVSEWHVRLANALNAEDRVLTFNWDTLLDRALSESGRWSMDSGYGFTPKKILRGAWHSPGSTRASEPLLLKLHGSTNWLTSHTSDMRSDARVQTTPLDTVHVYEHTDAPYDTYKGRFIAGYAPFSYGYYPPNIPDDKGQAAPPGYSFLQLSEQRPDLGDGVSGRSGLVSMPLIIPPVRQKQYDAFGHLYEGLWNKAEGALASADTITLIGYSFPVTDVRSQELFRSAFAKRTDLPRITIVNPEPDAIMQRFVHDFGVPETHLTIYKEFLSPSSPTYL